MFHVYGGIGVIIPKKYFRALKRLILSLCFEVLFLSFYLLVCCSVLLSYYLVYCLSF